tara:strand:+ start:1170 stop:1943 length:774 start_codon:yes stop_codon:yes gene_type:complete
VVLLALIAIVGILTPKLLWMIEGYREFIWSMPIDVQYIIHPLFRMVLTLIGWAVIISMQERSKRPTMGLCVGWVLGVKAFVLGFACTLPMLVLGLMSEYSGSNRYDIMYKAISPGVTEEIFYRALLFGMLVQVARVPLWPSAIVTGIVFGLAHVDLTPDEGQTIIGQLNLWIMLIVLGGVMYAWMYSASRWNLWVVIALHIGMNLWWGMFDLTSSPLGEFGATLSRIVCVGLVVLFVFGLRVLEPGRKPTITHDAKT